MKKSLIFSAVLLVAALCVEFLVGALPWWVFLLAVVVPPITYLVFLGVCLIITLRYIKNNASEIDKAEFKKKLDKLKKL